MKTTIELAAELEAEKKLRDAGYMRNKCPNQRCLYLDKACPDCGGNGYIWESREMMLLRFDRSTQKLKRLCDNVDSWLNHRKVMEAYHKDREERRIQEAREREAKAIWPKVVRAAKIAWVGERGLARIR